MLDDVIAAILRLDPGDQQLLKAMALGYHERRRTGDTTALQTALVALWCRMSDPQGLSNN